SNFTLRILRPSDAATALVPVLAFLSIMTHQPRTTVRIMPVGASRRGCVSKHRSNPDKPVPPKYPKSPSLQKYARCHSIWSSLDARANRLIPQIVPKIQYLQYRRHLV